MSFTELSEQEIIRRNSLNELAKLGIEAYPAPEFQVNAHAAEIKEVRRNSRAPECGDCRTDDEPENYG